MSTPPLVILGAGPAASLLAMALERLGVGATVIGAPRRSSAVEGLSPRVVDALARYGCTQALTLLGPRWKRVSRWGGGESAANGEFVVERCAFDRALLADAHAAGVRYLEGTVLHVERSADRGYAVTWEARAGERHTTRARLLVECRGRTAPKVGPDLHAGASMVAIARTFAGVRARERMTLLESFPMGWAWGGADGTGAACVQVVVAPETVAAHAGHLNAVHSACLPHLRLIRDRLGDLGEPAGTARARGIRPVLRTPGFALDYLRVGDACYTGDPLSGHGVFEAASGALAAAPAINTLVNHARDARTAIDFLDERVRAIYQARMRAARDHYRTENAWRDEPFWRRMQHFDLPGGLADQEAADAVRLVEKGVVEDGRIVLRPVLVGPAFPRGVRYAGAVDVGTLIGLIRDRPGMSRDALSRAMALPHHEIDRACEFIRRIRQPSSSDPGGLSFQHA